MKTENIYDAIGEIDDALIVSAKRSSPRKKLQKRMVAATLIFIFALTAFLGINKIVPNPVQQPTHDTEPTEASSLETDAADAGEEPSSQLPEYIKPEADYLSYALVAGEYPLYKGSGSWIDDKITYGFNDSYISDIPIEFYKEFIQNSLLENPTENEVVSPFSVFLSLGIVSEISDGESRSQILKTLGFDSVGSLRSHALSAWLDIYENGNVFTAESSKNYCIPANSIWLNDTFRMKGNADTNDILKYQYFASLFQGDPNNADYINAYREWLNKNTGGMLNNSVDNSTLSPDALMTIISTLYLDSSWKIIFDKKLTTTGTFYGTNGTQTADFMHAGNYTPALCYESPTYLAVCKSAFAGNMWFILPSEESTLTDVITSGTFMDICIYEAEEEGSDYKANQTAKSRFAPPEDEYDLYSVKTTLPKFDVNSNVKLTNCLITMGIKDIFNHETANFSYFKNEQNPVFISDIEQSARYSINEIGISAAAITRTDFGMGDPRLKYIDFTLNRPFMFLFTKSGVPLFAGVIKNVT